MDKLWIPEGEHYGLKVRHTGFEDAGAFAGGGHKIIWHTTEGNGLSGAISTLNANRSAPQLVIDPKSAEVVQGIPFNRAGRSLEHTLGPETNRANCIQIEVVGFTHDAPAWSHATYRNLAALALLIEHRFDVPRKSPRSFVHPRKPTAEQFVRASGHFGHVHVPGNSHVDITGFRIMYLFELMKGLDK